MVTEPEDGECKNKFSLTTVAEVLFLLSLSNSKFPLISFHPNLLSGSSRELTPEEFARTDRAYFDGYKMSEQGDFRRQIADDKEALKKQELEELLGVAAIAGIEVKNPNDRLNKFEDGAFGDDDEELDLSI